MTIANKLGISNKMNHIVFIQDRDRMCSTNFNNWVYILSGPDQMFTCCIKTFEEHCLHRLVATLNHSWNSELQELLNRPKAKNRLCNCFRFTMSLICIAPVFWAFISTLPLRIHQISRPLNCSSEPPGNWSYIWYGRWIPNGKLQSNRHNKSKAMSQSVKISATYLNWATSRWLELHIDSI